MQTFDSNMTIGLRRKMVDEIIMHCQKMNFNNFDYIIEAFRTTPRHSFIPMGFETIAYELNPVLIDEDQTMSSPLTVAVQTYLLQPNRNDNILEVGTGSGYQAAILSQLCRKLHTIERHKSLYDKSSYKLNELKLTNVHALFKDGFEGYEEAAPYDKIIITCGAPEIPPMLIAQLKIGGTMLIPLDNEDGKQTMKHITKLSEDEIHEENFGTYQFVPMLKGLKHKII